MFAFFVMSKLAARIRHFINIKIIFVKICLKLWSTPSILSTESCSFD